MAKQSYWTWYLKTISEKEQVKPKFNLGNISTTNSKTNIYSNILAKVNEPVKTNFKPPTQQTTGAWTTMPTQINKSLLNQITSQKQVFTPTKPATIWTQAKASDKNLIQRYLDDENEDYDNRKAIMEMIQNWEDESFIEDSIVNKIWYTWTTKPKEQWFFESIKYKPYSQDEVTAYDPNKSTFKNVIEWQTRYGKNILWWLYNILPWIAELWTNVVKWVWTDMWMKFWNVLWIVDDEEYSKYEKWQIDKTGQMITWIVTDYANKYWTKEWFTKAVTEDPTAIVWDALSIIWWWVFTKWKLTNYQKVALETQKKNIINQVKNATTLEEKSALIKQWIEKSKQILEKTKQIKSNQEALDIVNKYNPYIAVPKLAIKGTVLWATKTAEVINKVWTPTTEYATKLMTWLNRDTQRFIKNEPDLWKKINNWEINADQLAQEVKTRIQSRLDSLSETWKGYETMKQDTTKFNKKEIQWIYDDVTNKEWLSKNLIELPLEDRWAIKQAQSYLDEYKWKELTTKEIIELKAKLRSLVSYWKWVTPQWERIVKSIITNLDNNLKSKVPWYAELDKTYWPERNFLNQVKKDILKPDWTLKDNAISIIRNLSNKWKEFKLERFEELFPWITKQIEWIKAFEDLQASIEWKTWSYARWVLLWWWWYAAWWIIGWLVTFILTHPKVASKVLEWYWLSKQYINQLFSKIKGNGIISKQEQSIIENAVKSTKSDDLLNNLQKDDWVPNIPNSNNANTRLLQKKWTTQTSKIDDIPPEEPPTLWWTKPKVVTPKKPNPINKKWFIELNPKLPKPIKPKVSEELKPLIEESNKYKSVDEIYNDIIKNNKVPYNIPENWESKFDKFSYDLDKYKKEWEVIPYSKVIQKTAIPDLLKKENIKLVYTNNAKLRWIYENWKIFINEWYDWKNWIDNFFEKKHWITLNEYFNLRRYKNIETRSVKLREKQENIKSNLWNLLNEIQTRSDKAKNSWLSYERLQRELDYYENKWYYWEDYDKVKERLHSMKLNYWRKQNLVSDAIWIAKDNNIKVVIWNDSKIINWEIIETPVIYFELPNWQASFHLPNVDPIKYSKKYWIEYNPNYEWSWLNNTSDVIDKYNKQIYKQSHK